MTVTALKFWLKVSLGKVGSEFGDRKQISSRIPIGNHFLGVAAETFTMKRLLMIN